MKLLKTSALVLCLVFLFTPLLSKAQALSPTQIYNTGNIVENTPQGGPTPWVGGVYQDNLTCWSGGDPGYCGPNAIVRPGGNINFSYGTTNLYQMQAIANVLPNSGTGLSVNGYNFGFTAKNGNGWDDGRLDYLTAYVSLYDTKGSTVFNKNYDLNSKFNWTSFNYSETFNSPFASKDLSSVQYGFVGRDNNFWAGPYGPEIYNVNFNLNYSVDPCATNPLYSPTCPGYLEALAKLAPPPVVAETLVLPPMPILADSSMQMQSGQLAPSPGSQPSPESPAPSDNTQAPQPTMQQAGPSPAAAPIPVQQQAASSQPSATSPQTKIGEVSESGGGSKSTVSLSSILSMIGSNQEKTAALEKSVVQAADAQAFSAGETAKAMAEKIAGEAQSQSIAIANSQALTSSQTSNVQLFSSPSQNGAIAIQGNLQANAVLNTARLEQSLASVSSQSYSSTSQSQQNTQIESKQEISSLTASTIAYVPKAIATTSETNSAPAGLYVQQKETMINVENLVPQSSVYVPKTFTQNAMETTETQVTAYIPKSSFSETVENLVPQSSVYVPKTFQPSIVENTITQSTQTISFNRIQQEVKQEVMHSSSQLGLQPPKYDPPKIENSYTTPNLVIPQYQPSTRQEFSIVSASPTISYSLVPSIRYTPQIQFDTITSEPIKFGYKSPVENAIEAKPFLPEIKTDTQLGSSVKKSVQNNELAGNVTVEAIAKQPENFVQYFAMMPDNTFYTPKEIYRNQKTVDNVRLMRGLTGGSDKLHQQMVDQQFK